MQILGIDPGRTTGYATILVPEDSKKFEVVQFDSTKDLTLLAIQDQILAADVVVFETFEVRPRQARTGAFDWDPMETPQVIGALKLLCQIHEKLIVPQSPSVKPVGYGFLRRKYVRGKKNMHSVDALAHAVYYAVKHKIAKPLGT